MELPGKSIGGLSPTLWDSMKAEAARISQEYGLDANRVQKVAEALLLHSTTDDPMAVVLGEDGTSIEFHLEELLEAINQMGPDKALEYLEAEDISVLRRRYATYETLSCGWQPLYSIAELGELAKATRQHLSVQKDRLILLGSCTPNVPSQGIVFLSLSTLLLRNPIHTINETPTGPEATTSCEPDEKYPSVKELTDVRRRLHEVQSSLLELIERACLENWPRGTLRTCAVDLLGKTVSEEDISLCLSLEVGEETVSCPTRGVLESDIPFGGSFLGGLVTMLEVLCHAETELELHLYDDAHRNLPGFIMTGEALTLRKLRAGYFAGLCRPEARRLNEALDTFARTKSLTEAFEEEFYEAYSKALLEEHYVLCGADMLPKADARKIQEKTREFRDFLLRSYRLNRVVPSALSVSIGDDGERPAGDRRIFFENGHWSICFKGRKTVIRDMLGLHYIAAILKSHPIPIELTGLDDLLDRRSAIVARHNSGMSSSSLIPREESYQEDLGTEVALALPTTDANTLADVRKRLDELTALIRDERDSGRREEYQGEIELCTKYLMENGYEDRHASLRPRLMKDVQIEKLRLAVQMAVKRALGALSKTDRELADDLATISIGRKCRYKAPPDKRWTN